MKIGFFEIQPEEQEVLASAFSKDEIFFSSKVANSKVKDVEVLCVFVNSKVNEELLKKLPNLKLITTRSTGFNHIDLSACKKRKIKVCTVPVYGENTVAEYAFALILGLSRKLISCVNTLSKRCFSYPELRGIDLNGKTLGIIGCGNIGKNMAKIGNGFGMKVLVFDLYKIPGLAKKLEFKYVSFDCLLKESDIITLHLPYNKHTHHLINGKKLKLMKKSAYLINTSRGEIIDTIALVSALKNKKIAGAGLDVLEGEKVILKKAKNKVDKKVLKASKTLLKMKQVLVTPHNAFNTQEALNRILQTTIKNIKGFKKGKSVNLVK